MSSVLLIDDNSLDNFIHRKLLEIEGFSSEIVEFTSAALALIHLRNLQPDNKNLPALIFLDLTMPHIDGFQFLDEFQTFPEWLKKMCKIIVLSSSVDIRDAEKAKVNSQVEDFVSKPLTVEQIRYYM